MTAWQAYRIYMAELLLRPMLWLAPKDCQEGMTLIRWIHGYASTVRATAVKASVLVCALLLTACEISGPIRNWEVTTRAKDATPRVGRFTSERWASGGSMGAENETCVLFYTNGHQRGVACGESIEIRDLGPWKSDPSVWQANEKQR